MKLPSVGFFHPPLEPIGGGFFFMREEGCELQPIKSGQNKFFEKDDFSYDHSSKIV